MHQVFSVYLLDVPILLRLKLLLCGTLRVFHSYHLFSRVRGSFLLPSE